MTQDKCSAVFTVRLEVTVRTFLTCSGKWYCTAPAIGLDGWGDTEKQALSEINRQIAERNRETYKAHGSQTN